MKPGHRRRPGEGRPIRSFEGTLALLARTRELAPTVINLGIGTSQYPLWDDVQSFSFELRHLMSYGPAVGDLTLRNQICDLLKWLHPGSHVEPDRVVITDGGSNALYLALLSLVQPGEEVLISEIHYPSFQPLITAVGARERTWSMDEQKRPVWASLRAAISERTAAVLIDSPSNPFGVPISCDDYAQLAALGVPIVSDEVYNGTGVCTGASVIGRPGTHFMVGSFSKLFAMPGLRLGFLVTPDCAVDVVNKMRMSLNIATAIPSQKLGLRLLECAEQVIPKHREYLSTRRRVAIDVCRAAGLPLVNEGRGDGFYVCGDLRSIRMGSVEFANRLLDVAQVTVCPGADFVADGDPGFVRINLAVDLAKLKTGLQRVGEFYNATLEAQEGGPMARSLAIRHV